MTSYLPDSGFLYATVDESDAHHVSVIAATKRIRGEVLLPIPAITETAYFLAKNRGVNYLATFLKDLPNSKFELVAPTDFDYIRSAEILRKYNDANIDFVDACIVAMAERLNITKILTVDRRHFQIFRPKHCKSFEIIP